MMTFFAASVDIDSFLEGPLEQFSAKLQADLGALGFLQIWTEL
jgi:hypothetical protein